MLNKKIKFKILKLNDDKIPELVQLETEAEGEGYKFVGRAIYEFLSGENDFTGKGEIFYGAYRGKWCLGICGLNIDPYTDEIDVGRVRHLYVSEQVRNMGVASALVKKVIEHAKKNFKVLRLKSTPLANDFYTKLGFSINTGKNESHRMVLKR